MLDGEYNNYWAGTVAYESLKYYITINKDGLKNAIVRLIAGDRCKVNVGTFENDMTKINSRDDVLTILIHLGYLGYDSKKEEAYIPNEEVRKAFTGEAYHGNILLVGINYQKGDGGKKHTCIIEEYKK